MRGEDRITVSIAWYAALMLTIAGWVLVAMWLFTVHSTALRNSRCEVLLPHADVATVEQWQAFSEGRELDYTNGAWYVIATGEPIGYSGSEDGTVFEARDCVL